MKAYNRTLRPKKKDQRSSKITWGGGRKEGRGGSSTIASHPAASGCGQNQTGNYEMQSREDQEQQA